MILEKQIYAVGFPNLMQECILLYDTSDRQKTSFVAFKFLSNRCSTANNKIRDIRAIRVQEKSVFSVPSVGAETSENNKRIAKNTLLLYFRMLFLMVVSLYTSRGILHAVGV